MTRRMRSQWFRGMVLSDHRPARRGAARDVRRRPLRLEPLEDRRLLATITVNTIVDENDGVATGGVSLRDALAAAVSGDTIDFDPALVSGGPATIDLAHGQLVANTAVTIDGPGAELLTIDANQASRVFEAFADCTIAGLTLTGGNADTGGGIKANAPLTVRDSIITGNTASQFGAGVSAPAGVTVERSTISNNQGGTGGGIHASGANILDSTISGNTASTGGGVAIIGDGDLTITRSTISGNTSTQLFQVAGGSAILVYTYFLPGAVTLNQCTISGNTAAGVSRGTIAIGFTNISFSISHCVITNNVGNVFDGGTAVTATIRSSIIMGTWDSGFIHDRGYNLFQMVPEPDDWTVHPTSQTGVANPGLLPLADNGGPTPTHALKPSSIALNAGDPAAVPGAGGVPLTDQRGFDRIYGGRIDIGPFELEYPIVDALTVDTLADELDNDLSPGDLSLREALLWAPIAATRTVTFAPELSGGVISLSMGELVIDGDTTVDGTALAAPVTIDAHDASRVLRVDDLRDDHLLDVTIRGLVLTGGHVDQNTPPLHGNKVFNIGSGGAIYNTESLELDRVTITGNSATNWGGGIFSFRPILASGPQSELVITNSTIRDNTAGVGGGLGTNFNAPQVLDSTISGNTASAGGGIFMRSSSALRLERSIVSGNTATGGSPYGNGGGGIGTHNVRPFTQPLPLEIIDSRITGNMAAGSGGGAYLYGAPHTRIVRSLVDGNQAGGLGGGLAIRLGTDGVSIIDSTISGNTAAVGGGVTDFVATTIAVTRSTISGNTAGSNGALASTNWATITESTISGNVSTDGSANVDLFRGELRHNTITANQGGGVFAAHDTKFYSNIIAGNTAVDFQTLPQDRQNTSLGYNLVGTTTGFAVFSASTNDLVGVSDPMLGPLADNGGPTKTHLPLAGSPVLDAGDPFFHPASAGLLYDQRGEPWSRVERTTPPVAADYVGLAEIRFGAAGGELVTPTAIFASSYYSGQQDPANLINGSGLDTSSGAVLTYTHAPHASANGMWHAGAGQGTGGAAPVVDDQYLVLDLGATYDLSQAYLWQMVQTNLLGRGIKEFRLLASPDAPDPLDAANPPAVYDLAGFTEVLGATQLAQLATAGAAPTQAFALTAATGVRQVYVDIISSFNTGARIDIGAVEAAPPPPPSADFDQDGLVDGADFLTWQRGLGRTDAGHSDGDADHDRDVDADDLALWQAGYGASAASGGASAAARAAASEPGADPRLAEAASPAEASDANRFTLPAGTWLSQPAEARALRPPARELLRVDLGEADSAAKRPAAADRRDEALAAWLAADRRTSAFLPDADAAHGAACDAALGELVESETLAVGRWLLT